MFNCDRKDMQPVNMCADYYPKGSQLEYEAPTVLSKFSETMLRFTDLVFTSGELELGSCNSRSLLVIKDLR